jgi:hypothetical protein
MRETLPEHGGQRRMNCPYCEAPTNARYCCAVCRLADKAELAHFRRPYLSELRSDEPFPNFVRELRSILLAARAMTHRTSVCRTA